MVKSRRRNAFAKARTRSNDDTARTLIREYDSAGRLTILHEPTESLYAVQYTWDARSRIDDVNFGWKGSGYGEERYCKRCG